MHGAAIKIQGVVEKWVIVKPEQARVIPSTGGEKIIAVACRIYLVPAILALHSVVCFFWALNAVTGFSLESLRPSDIMTALFSSVLIILSIS